MLFSIQKPLFRSINYVLLSALSFNILLPGFNGWAAVADGPFLKPVPVYSYASGSAKESESEAAEVKTGAVLKQSEQNLSSGQSLRAVAAAAGGPGQTESSGFSLSSNDDMIDPFTGDFSYSIPLMDVEGFPIAINYNSHIGMNDEASWVGLGWNLNVGSIAREMRGIPDEFDGSQKIDRTHSQLPNTTSSGQKYGALGAVTFKKTVLGRESKIGVDVSLLWGSYQSTYTGKGKTFDFNIGGSLSLPLGDNGLDFGPKVSLGYSRDTKNGIGVSTSFGVMSNYEKEGGSGLGAFGGLNFGSHFSSREGVTSRSLNLTTGPSYGAFRFPVTTGSNWTLGTLTYVPRHEFNGRSEATSTIADLTYGVGVAGLYAKVGLEANFYNSDQTINSTVNNSPAVGYMHLQKRNQSSAILDYNRESGQEFSENMRSSAYGFPTYDIFFASALGMNGTFRAHRREVGTYGDSRSSIDIDTKTRQAEAGLMGLPPTGYVISYSEVNTNGESASGQWQDGKVFVPGADESVFFRGIGEMTPVNTQLFDYMGKEEPARLELTKSTSGDLEILTTSNVVAGGASINVSPSAIAPLLKQDMRSTIYNPIPASKLSVSDPYVRRYNENSFAPAVSAAFVRQDEKHAPNHFSAVEVRTPDGMNYYYGIPAYSLSSSEVAFSSSAASANAQGLVTIGAGENSTGNSSGLSHYYDKTTVPAYASAFLISAVTSDNYFDRMGDGLTADDAGSYYKINHTRIYDKDTPFQWRFPVNDAMFSEGLLAVDSDNSASYSFGQKEVWYTHSIESKNMVAEFYLSDQRDDVYSSYSENGGLDPVKHLRKLEKIVLYNRNERLTKGAAAAPLQTVEFIYDYSLCLNTPTNKNTAGNPGGANTGKLTLKEIRIYSGEKSQETATMPYLFDYSPVNPPHNYQAVDRWGNYLPYNSSTDLPRDLFPYATQNQAAADNAASAWRLVKITSPGGAYMTVDYEADSYAYVQNKRAMKHATIKGFTSEVELSYLQNQSSWDGSSRVSTNLQKNMSNNEFCNLAGITSLQFNELRAAALMGIIFPTTSNALLTQLDQLPNNVVVFELQKIYTGSKQDADAAFRRDYMDEKNSNGNWLQKDIYLRSFVNVKNGAGFEMVPTFAPRRQMPVRFSGTLNLSEVASCGVMPAVNGEYKYGYVVLEKVRSTDQKRFIYMGPVQKTALEFAKLHLTEIVYGTCQSCDGDLSIDKGSFWKRDIYEKMAKYGYCGSITTSLPSQIRLFEPNNKKFGGNGRVKSIVIHDNWDENTRISSTETETAGEYTWNYLYDRPSDGVAAYEPSMGNDENPFYGWLRYTNNSVSFPDASKYHVTPTGYMLYPAPVVGYEEVSKTFSGDFGAAHYYYHTAREYPTLSNSTIMVPTEADKTNFLKTEIDLFAFSQGHSVVTNDFHGKPDRMELTGPSDASQNIRSVKYHYKPLRDKIAMLDQNGALSSESVAMEYDISVDTRIMETTLKVANIGAYLVFKFPFLPVGGGPIWQKSVRKTGFYLHTINKHVNYSAIVNRIETNELGSVSQAENLVYDRKTGNVLLSSLTDEFEDKLYSFNYPAHWYYGTLRNPLMQSMQAVTGTMSSVFTASSSLNELFNTGDQVSYYNGSTTATAYVYSVSGSTMRLIDASGNALTGSGTVTVTLVKSGRKNLQNLMMASVITKRNPLSGMMFTFPSTDIIGAAAISLKPQTTVRCLSGGRISVKEGNVYNPFTLGLMNNLYPDMQYTVQTERDYAETHGGRFNGTYITYLPFYKKGAGSEWFKIDETGYSGTDGTLRNWRSGKRINKTDEFGKSIEEVNEINIYSSILYGFNRYNKMIPVAGALNARYFEIAYDGFEDYNYLDPGNVESHFDFSAVLDGNVGIDNTVRHSGNSSLRIYPGISATVTRNTTPSSECLEGTPAVDKYTTTSCFCIKQFEPYVSKTYVVSLWVKGQLVNDVTNRYSDVAASISFTGSSTTFPIVASGEIIDGWQRAEAEFTVPAAATAIKVNLINATSEDGVAVYFDDIRIHPKLAAITTTVYDPETLLPTAVHDNSNFTTFYNYDENLSPIGKRVETLNGIQTISEIEGGSIKTYKED
jgi:hypothetical protein